MMTAYLLASIDTSNKPPVIRSIGIYGESEREITTSSRTPYARLMEASGDSFAEAKANIIDRIDSPYHAWMLALLDAESMSSRILLKAHSKSKKP